MVATLPFLIFLSVVATPWSAARIAAFHSGGAGSDFRCPGARFQREAMAAILAALHGAACTRKLSRNGCHYHTA